MKSIYYFLFASVILLSGCIQQKQPILASNQNSNTNISNSIYNNNISNFDSTTYNQDLNDVIIQMANQLFNSNTIKNKKTRIILTSYVNLDHLGVTTTFGRLLSESMFNELHINNFNVTDFRGQEAVTVTQDGEFHITRDTEKLKDTITAIDYILVGTYIKFENKSFLINSRIIDSVSGEIISSSRVIYKPLDCTLYSLCNKESTKRIAKIETKSNINNIQENRIVNTPIMIIEDK